MSDNTMVRLLELITLRPLLKKFQNFLNRVLGAWPFENHFRNTKSKSLRRFDEITRLERKQNLQELRNLLVMNSQCESQRRIHYPAPKRLAELEYKVFSQFGDDGIIEYLSGFVPATQQRFIEFGVENYQEANTRLLMERDNWSGLVIDGSPKNIKFLRNRPDFWKYDLTAIDAFITAENINNIFIENKFVDDIGLLSIDVDGNDYWIWKAIDTVRPQIVVCEYNAIFGPTAAITIPYDPLFVRTSSHHSNLYAGASLAALNLLAQKQGYRFIGCNSSGNNAYFICSTLDVGLPFLSVKSGFVQSKFREARDENGKLLLRRADECLNLISDLPVIDVRTDRELSIGKALDQGENSGI